MAAADNDSDQPEEAITSEEIHGEEPPAKRHMTSSRNACLSPHPDVFSFYIV